MSGEGIAVEALTDLYGNRHSYEVYSARKHGELLTLLDMTTTRNIMTTAFGVLNFVLGFVGAYFFRKRNQLRLDRTRENNSTIPISHLTPWLSLTDSLSYAWNTRKLPGGLYGLLMLSAGVFGLAPQYFVNSFINSVNLQGDCNFIEGVIMGTSSGPSPVPVSTFPAADIVSVGQLNAYTNGGELGIYSKVNYTSTTFRPTDADVLGKWTCASQGNVSIDSRDLQNATINETLLVLDYLYPDANYATGSYEITRSGTTGGVLGFLAWSADQSEDSQVPWLNVRALVATRVNSEASETVSANKLQCYLSITPGGNPGWSPPIIQSYSTLVEWAPTTFGFVSFFEYNDYNFPLEWMLNRLVMVAGTGNVDRRPTSDLPDSDAGSYGCIVRATLIEPEIWAILMGIFLILVMLSLRLLIDLVIIRRQGKLHDLRDQLVDVAPSTILERQLSSLKRTSKDPTIKASEMRHYSYGWDGVEENFVPGKTTVITNAATVPHQNGHTKAPEATVQLDDHTTAGLSASA